MSNLSLEMVTLNHIIVFSVFQYDESQMGPGPFSTLLCRWSNGYTAVHTTSHKIFLNLLEIK
jgi:hypothetical protein